MNRHELSDQQWQRLAPLLPAERPPKRRRPYHSHRQIINGILWILATGVPWRDIPERYGPWSTIANRFYRWQRQGVWQHLFLNLLREADCHGQIDWTLHFVDGTVIRAHQHAAGARRPNGDEALGRSRGGFSTKLHLRADRHGTPLVLFITAGQAHEQTMFLPLLQTKVIRTGRRGRPRQRPQRLCGDKGYSSRQNRRYLQAHGIGIIIPRKRNERHRGAFDRSAYRERNVIERLINRFKQYRRVATRYEKRGCYFLAMVTLAALLMWL